MNYNLLGNSNLKICQVSFGCMSLGDDHEANAKLLRSVYDNGVNHFETADIYQNGLNEITVGKVFTEIRNQQQLDECISAKKSERLSSEYYGILVGSIVRNQYD